MSVRSPRSVPGWELVLWLLIFPGKGQSSHFLSPYQESNSISLFQLALSWKKSPCLDRELWSVCCCPQAFKLSVWHHWRQSWRRCSQWALASQCKLALVLHCASPKGCLALHCQMTRWNSSSPWQKWIILSFEWGSPIPKAESIPGPRQEPWLPSWTAREALFPDNGISHS